MAVVGLEGPIPPRSAPLPQFPHGQGLGVQEISTLSGNLGCTSPFVVHPLDGSEHCVPLGGGHHGMLHPPTNTPLHLPLQGGTVQTGYPSAPHIPPPRAMGPRDPRAGRCLRCVFQQLRELDPG